MELLRAIDRWAVEASTTYRRRRQDVLGALGVRTRYEQSLASAPDTADLPAEHPLLSVVVPVYRPDPILLVETVSSLRAQLYPHWEAILVDDASGRPALSDVLAGLAECDPRVRTFTRAQNGGIAAATNEGIAAARGEWVVLLDQGDLLAPHALLEVARAGAGADVIYSDDDKVTLDGRRYDPHRKPGWEPSRLLESCYFGHVKAFRRALLNELGGLREGLPGAEDYDLCLRATEKTERVVHLPQVLYHWRAHPGSTAVSGAQKPESFAAGRRAIEDALARRGLRGRVERPERARRLGMASYRVTLEPSEVTP